MEAAPSIEAVLGCGHLSLQVLHLAIRPELIVIVLAGRAESASCPSCGGPSQRVHSRYMRTITDLPCFGTPVMLRYQVRRFFCDDLDCPQQIFAERLDPIVRRRGRTTTRLDRKLASIGLECGGEPGRRLSAGLGIRTSGETILRRVRRVALTPEAELTPSVIGIDDFALRKGRRYGTVLVDHESHNVIDLLPERSSESTTRWLAARGPVRVVTRDRSNLYARGISDANPQAIQVADRFHLHANLREALVRLLDRHQPDVRAAAVTSLAAAVAAPPAAADSDSPALSKSARRAQRRARRQVTRRQVVELNELGLNISAIARELGMDRGRVRRLLQPGPEPAAVPRQRTIDPYAQPLRQLWDSGVHNNRELYRRISAMGFGGSLHMVHRCVAPWRQAAIRADATAPKPRASDARAARVSSTRLSWLLLSRKIERNPQEQKLIEALLRDCEPVRLARDLSLRFKEILPQRQAGPLLTWTDRATQADVPEEIRSFAQGLLRDWPSVKAAAELPWSNGRVEGHVNRIKLIKRKMYGRASFDLLRIRVMARGP